MAARMDQGVTPELARMSGYDHTTLAKHLKRLREEAHPLVERIVPGRGKHGDRYVLLVPEPYRADAVARMWRGGRIETTHQALNLEGAAWRCCHVRRPCRRCARSPPSAWPTGRPRGGCGATGR
ncbi:hypothetical protein AB0G05_45125 [Nonomuraea wenchangensis]